MEYAKNEEELKFEVEEIRRNMIKEMNHKN